MKDFELGWREFFYVVLVVVFLFFCFVWIENPWNSSVVFEDSIWGVGVVSPNWLLEIPLFVGVLLIVFYFMIK